MVLTMILDPVFMIPMANLYQNKESNIRKTWMLMSGFFVLIIAIGWIFSQYYGNPAILYGFALFSVIMNIVSYWYSDSIVVGLMRAKPAGEKEFAELHRIVENLAITAGLPKPKIYYVDDPAPNAFATGRDPNHAIVAVTRGLLERLDRSELEGVLAHELSHVGNRDMLVSTVAVVLAGVIAMLSDLFLRSLMWGGRRRDDRGNGSAVIYALALIGAILAPIAAMLMQLAISRKREFLADASGALLTRYPEGLAKALEKISSDPSIMRNPSPAAAHLWLSDPYKGNKQASWIAKMFMTHPPVEERVRALRGITIEK